MSDRRERGDAVERATLAHLQQAGLKPLATNAYYPGGELDLVMLDPSSGGAEGVVFVEVRYRRNASFGGGALSVDAGKRRKLVRAAQQFLLAHPHLAQSPCRFDVVEADGDPSMPRLQWIRDAFRADDA